MFEIYKVGEQRPVESFDGPAAFGTSKHWRYDAAKIPIKT